MRRLHITPHLSVEELEQRYRQAHDPVERSHWQIIWLQAQGNAVKTIAQMTSYSTTWIYTILRRYDAHGPAGVGDRRHQNPGQPPLVPPDVRAELAALLDGPAPDGGLWTSAKVAAWLTQRLGRPFHPQRGWELLRALGYRSYAPRPRHRKADPAQQEQWKKKLPDEIAAIQAAHPTVTTWEVWTMDEHRIGLKPIVRQVWAKQGARPIIIVQHRYDWCYLYGFVCPQTGVTFWLILPRVSIALFSLALAELAQFLGLGPDKHLILVLDQAGWHTSEQVVVPAGIHLIFQPAYSPEVQPAERLWSVTDEGIANQHFETLDDLVAAQAERCEMMLDMTDEIRSRTNYHWWPQLEAAA